MSDPRLKIPKSLREVTLWVHPEGRVIGSLFLRQQSIHHAGEEEPREVLNQDRPFLVLQRDTPDELRFYNRAAIIRVEYTAADDEGSDRAGMITLACELHMMDGSFIKGTIMERLPAGSARLFDYINSEKERFIRVFQDEGTIGLINKAYVVQVVAR